MWNLSTQDGKVYINANNTRIEDTFLEYSAKSGISINLLNFSGEVGIHCSLFADTLSENVSSSCLDEQVYSKSVAIKLKCEREPFSVIKKLILRDAIENCINEISSYYWLVRRIFPIPDTTFRTTTWSLVCLSDVTHKSSKLICFPIIKLLFWVLVSTLACHQPRWMPFLWLLELKSLLIKWKTNYQTPIFCADLSCLYSTLVNLITYCLAV